MKNAVFVVISSLFILIPQKSNAFPDMIRHGYTNCTACHISPSGGGVLNAYGRNLSKDLISTWSYDKEELPLHGLVDTTKIDDWLAFGGDVRNVQVHQENEQIRRGSWIKMQAGAEIAVVQPKWALVSFIGQYISKDEWQAYSPRYYALWTPIEKLYFKVGRFLPNYGINFSDHILSIRGPLQLGYGQEKNSAEVYWLGESWIFSGAYYKTPEQLSANNQTGVVGTASYAFWDKNKVGVQALSEKDDIQKRLIYGLNASLSWTKDFYTLVEVDQQVVSQNSGSSADVKGIYAHHRTGYEVYKGVNLIFLNDYYQTNVEQSKTKDYKYGPGVQWTPRPHWDLQAFWTRQQKGTLENEGDYAWLVLHYYL